MPQHPNSDAEYLPIGGVKSGWLPPVSSEDPARPERLGGYHIQLLLGSGGMATVYLASIGTCSGSRRWCALKLLRSELAENETHLGMFFGEAKIGSEISHPHVCRVFDYGYLDGKPYLSMEYLRGKSLAGVRRALGEVPEPARHAARIARILADVSEGLDAIHEYRSASEGPLHVVHRDISPDNLIVTFDGFVKIIDFGLAKADRRGERTQPGILKGKLSYIAPELLRGGAPDARADIWSLGVVAWELLTGRRLFHRSTDAQTLKAVVDGEIKAPSAVVPGLPAELDAIVLWALAREPGERCPSAAELHARLWEFLVRDGRLVHHRDLAAWLDRLFPGERERASHLLEAAQPTGAVSGPVESEPVPEKPLAAFERWNVRISQLALRCWQPPARVSLVVALIACALVGVSGWTVSRLRPPPPAQASMSAGPAQAPRLPAGQELARTQLTASGGFVVEVERPELSNDVIVRVRATPSSEPEPRLGTDHAEAVIRPRPMSSKREAP